MKSNLVFISESCESCQRPHTFSKKGGTCEYLTVKMQGEPVSILKCTACRFYLVDTDKVKALNSTLG